ncbi:MAG: hypothetical protein JOZ41_17755 [Chloroflexi bacterium]|nr:hypothetical protein [Chloroflexota bacterium]
MIGPRWLRGARHALQSRVARPGEQAVRSSQVWNDEARALWRDVAQTLGRSAEEAGAAFGDDETRDLRTSVARLGDLMRSQAFLWTELGLKAQERSSRVGRIFLEPVRVPLEWMPRALVMASAAGDIYAGYTLLRDRAKRWPSLERPRDWELQHRRGATHVLDTITSLGGVLIKAGQFASVRPDLLPRPYIEQPGPRLVILDHGLTIELSRPVVRGLAGMVRALVAGDFVALSAAMAEAGLPVDEGAGAMSLLRLAGVVLGVHGTEGIESLGQQLGTSIERVPEELITVGRALGLLNGVTRQLDPDLDPLAIVAIYAER